MAISAREYTERIEAIRAEMTPDDASCPTCGSATPPRVVDKRCTGCRRMLPIERFGRKNDRRRGRVYVREVCRDCNARACKRWRRRQKLRLLRRAS